MWRVEQISNEPTPRCAHQSESINDYLYVFGGWNDDNQMLNDLYKFDVDNWEWEEIKVADNFITPRNGHSINSYNNKLIVFGGGSFSGFLNDINIFDPVKLQWNCINTTGDIPSVRSKHTSTLIGNKLYIFGGGDGIRLYNDMYCLDLETFEWKKIIYNNSNNESDKVTLIPSARWGHTMVSLGDNKTMILFAGHAGTKRINDLYLFNTENNEWYQVDLAKDGDNIPLARAGHSSLMVGYHMIVFGGGDGHIINDLYGLDTRVWRWWKIKIDNTPDARCAHSATIIKNKLLIFGGGNGIQCLKKLLVLENLDQLESIYQNRNSIKTSSPININNNNNNNNNQSTSSSPSSPQNVNILKIDKNLDHIKKSISQISANIEFKSKNIENNNHKILPFFPSFKDKNDNDNNDSIIENINNINNKSIKNIDNINNNINQHNNIRKDLKNSCLTEYQRKDIKYFLANIGMGKYVTKFIEEEIDTTILHLLTEDHLKEIGITSLGERLLIIKGIRESSLYILNGLPSISTEN